MLDKKSILIFYCVVLASVLAVETANKRSNYDTYAAPENGTCYKRVPYDEAVIANLSQGLIKTESTTPPPGIQTWITIIDCCDGYRRNDEYGDCEFYCEEGCSGGNCTGPNECTCEDGWQAEHGECRPVCRQRCPQNSYCFSPNECACLFGFEEIDGICQPICQHNCRNGDCIAPTDCRCHRGYFLNETRHCEPICESKCQHGFCAAPGVCSCDQGYVNQLYDAESCIPECATECVNGQCVAPNVCTCNPGYQQNDNGTCEAQCEKTCPENGLCVAPNQCGCNKGYMLDIQGKNCIKLPKNTQTYHPNREVFPSRNNQGQVYQQGQNSYNTQRNRPYGNVDKTDGTQRPNYGRNNYPNRQGGVYHTDNPYGYGQTDNPQGVVGLELTTQNPRQGPYGTYGQTPRPQRPLTQQGSYATSTPYPISGTREGIEVTTTYRTPLNDPRYTTLRPFAPLNPYPTQTPTQTYGSQPEYNYGNRGNRPINGSLQGPFAPPRYHTTQSPLQPDEPRPTLGPYGPYDSHTQSPWNHNRNPNEQATPNNYPNQRQNPYDQHGGVNNPYNPYSPTTPRDQEGVKTGQRRPPYAPQLPYSPHTPYNPYAPISPHDTQGAKTSHGRPPYGSQGSDQTYNPYAPNAPYNPRPTSGAQRPPTDIYSRSSVIQSNPHSGVSYSYGIDHLNRDPYVQPGTSNIGEIIIVDGPQIPGVNQLQPFCNGPCINSHCIGLNLCMCEIGFIPDPRNPNGNACVPFG